jgi:hypothetical protein
VSYYIAPQNGNLDVGDMVVYRVVKRLSDFKPEEGQKYRVFKGKKEMQNGFTVPMYIGENGKLKKVSKEFVLRF